MQIGVMAVLVLTLVFPACGSTGPGGPAELLAREGHAMAYDAALQHVVLFGGRGPTTTGGATQEQHTLWEWTGLGWALVDDGAGGPAPRNTAGLAFDAATGHMIVVGGRQGTAPDSPAFDDTWEWNGTTWSQVTGSTPGKRFHFAMAYDEARSRLVLYGGFDALTLSEKHDLWERTGTAWGVTAAAGPGGTFAPVAVYDPQAALTWILVSSTADRTISTYTWNGDSLHLANGTGPQITGYAAAALGDTTGLLLFGGSDGPSLLADTWRWNGTTWTKLTPATAPPARIGGAMARDAVRDRLVLYGGETQSATLADTWEFDGATWTIITPPPHL